MNRVKIEEALKKCIAILDASEDEFKSSKEKLSELLSRLNKGRFHLAVLGQFKRGKSTLVNALLGENILPVAVVPLTAIPTFIFFGDKIYVKIFYSNREEDVEFFEDVESIKNFLEKYVTEKGNPENKLNISHVEIYYPSKLLKRGFVLIDTPGIGSTFHHNTEITVNFLPQCDAALFVTSADPPLTEMEVQFLKSVKSHVPKIFYVLNKIDYLDSDELTASMDFFKEILLQQEISEDSIEVYGVSAKKALKSKINNDKNQYKQSNFDILENAILDFMEKEKFKILCNAISKKSIDIIENILMQLKISIRSYETPLEELEKKIKILEEKIEEAKSRKTVVGDVLKGDMKRVESFLDSEADKLKDKAFEHFSGEIKKIIEDTNVNTIKENVQNYLNEKIPPYFEKEFGKFSRNFSEKASEILSSHEDKAVEVIESIRKNAAQLMNIPYKPLHGEKGLKMRLKPYWVVNRWDTTLTAISNTLVDMVVGKGLLKRRLLKRYLEKLEILIYSNIENLRWPIYQGVQDTFREFSYDFENQMQEVIAATKGAVEKAVKSKREETGRISYEVEKLKEFVGNIENVKFKLQEETNNL